MSLSQTDVAPEIGIKKCMFHARIGITWGELLDPGTSMASKNPCDIFPEPVVMAEYVAKQKSAFPLHQNSFCLVN